VAALAVVDSLGRALEKSGALKKGEFRRIVRETRTLLISSEYSGPVGAQAAELLSILIKA
jgi:hypothetical protein